jgi:membrane-associated protease RseP (regulator of RpoE activity)
MSEPDQSPGGVTYEPAPEVVRAAVSDPRPLASPAPSHSTRRRRVGLPIFLFLLTCASTFVAGATQYVTIYYVFKAIGVYPEPSSSWMPITPIEPSLMPLRVSLLQNWEPGLLYMACVLAILLTHEMGHFVMTVYYRVRASLPYFIPLPISPIGTMGAVIVMDSRSANRREIFDIGLAGPIAGLVVAIPIMWIGVQRLDFSPDPGEPTLPAPLLAKMAIDHVHPGKYNPDVGLSLTRMNPWFMAGWVGLLVTGLNMLPVSQLDGGHVTYALFGRWAHWIARGFMFVVFAYMTIMFLVYRTGPTWILMAILVMLMGTDHPPTRDDTVPLGPVRTFLGLLSLAIPIFCFVPDLAM